MSAVPLYFQIEQDLAQLSGIPENGKELRIAVNFCSNGAGKSLTSQFLHFIQQCSHVEDSGFTTDAACEGENLFNHVKAVPGAGVHGLQHFARDVARCVVGEGLGADENGREHVPQIMSDATRQSADCFEPLSA